MLRNREFTRADPRLGWLQAVLPAGAHRLATADEELAERLRGAGFEAGGPDCDAEIGVDGPRRADTVVAFVQRAEVRHALRALRAAGRLTRSTRVRLAVRRRVASLARSGYRTEVIWTQRGEPLELVGGERRSAGRPAAHRFPLGAVVVGRRGQAPTLLEEAIAAAGAETGTDLTPDRVAMGSSGVVLVLAPTVLARFACGEAAALLARQATNLTTLAAADPTIASRVPRLIGDGATGGVRWTITSRIEGEPAATPIAGAALEDSVSFLVSLFSVPGADVPVLDLQRVARVLGDAAPALRRDLSDVARQVAHRIGMLPHGFAHLDFWAGNLLLQDGRLSGIVDWVSGGGGRPPLLDLLHLRLSDAREPTNRRLGPAFLEHLWPLGPRDDDAVAEYCDRLGLVLDERTFRALLAAYWLVATARELWDFAEGEDVEDANWRRDNIHRVLAVVARDLTPAHDPGSWRRTAVTA